MKADERRGPLFEGVAIIGMAGRFPGAANVAEFWQNQLNGIESISHFRVDELEVPNAEELAKDPSYVKARSVLKDVDLFDADFFGILPREAELMDPQQRLFLESCWQAFEDAGYDPSACSGLIGVYGGSSQSTYFLTRLCTNPGFIAKYSGGYQVASYPEMMGNNPDFLCTRVSYKLNLRGPSFTMVAGCSSSLIAVTQACQSLLTYQNDMALAGGSSITFPQKRGSYCQEGGMISPDGHCRTFDADAQGTVFGSGVGVVLLKRFEEAMLDGDQIYAVIRGFAVNNDGAAKVGYAAPSVEGQARVIALAQEAAEVDPNTIGYVEAHGTGTPLGDPIELAALTQAFRARTARKHFCVVGTAKTNVGHLDIAAGVSGLIHATHVVRHGIFPPTLHFKKPNPKFDLDNSPFYVNAQLTPWTGDTNPRRAGVSAFGVGGTNAHVILEQAPADVSSTSKRGTQLLVLSARSDAALSCVADNLSSYLKKNPDTNLADIAWTLQVGRHPFSHRLALTARDVTETVAGLTHRNGKRGQTDGQLKKAPAIGFLFPGQGSQQPNMAREVYETETVFRQTVDLCAEILRPQLEADLRTLLYPPENASKTAKNRVNDTIIAQPAIFTVEYALAQLWISWGISPKFMLGHSVGEYVAACLAGVFSLEDALALIADRGRMMQDLPPGGMLSVRLPESEVRLRLTSSICLAAVNSRSQCVVAGPFEALEMLEAQLGREGIACRKLATSHAFHSAMMDPIVEPFTTRVAQVRLQPPQREYISGVTGTWVTDADAADPAYWARHFREPVQFAAAIEKLLNQPNAILLEVGPGRVLSALARQAAGLAANPTIVPSLSDGFSGESDATSLVTALGSIWVLGAQPNWKAVHAGERRKRISLPTYPFERKRFWLQLTDTAADPAAKVENPRLKSIAAESPKVEERTTTVSGLGQKNCAPQDAAGRVHGIRTLICEIFEELSGINLSAADGTANFLEMGFDSLFLTQVTQSLQHKFDLKITFRQLLGNQSTIDALTAYVNSELPSDVLSDPLLVASPVVTPAFSDPRARFEVPGDEREAAPTSVSYIERLMSEQLQAMNQLFARQLEAIRGISSPSLPEPTSTVSGSKPTSSASALQEASVRLATSAGPLSPQREETKEEFKPFGPYKPPQKGVAVELTERQQTSLRGFIERYSKRTAKSKSMTAESRPQLADPRVVAGFRPQWKEIVYPIITSRSKGSMLWDVDGNEYIDILNGFGPIMLGHRPEFIEKAIERQLHEGFETGPQTPLAGEVAKMFCAMTGNERMTFCNTGSEAVMAALRLSRTVTGRNKVVLFAGAYHGMFDEVLVKGFKKGGLPHSAPVAPGIPREMVANVTVLDYGAAESLEWIRQNAKDLAAVLVEPVQSRHPHFQPREFLQEIRRITQDSGTALIFDEVVTGFRVHPGGCQALFGIRADLATYGKVVAGGMPIGVLAGKARFMDALDGGAWQFGDDSYPEVGVTFFAGTFVRHPLTLAAIKSVLQHFQDEGPALQERLSERTAQMVRRINEICERNSVPTRLENFGSVFYFTFPSEERFASLFYYFLREKGIHVLEGFPCFLTTAHSDADIEKIIRAFKESALEMQAAGFLPPPPPNHSLSSGPDSAIPVAENVQKITESQKEIWLSTRLSDEASCAYNESFTLKIHGPFAESALRYSLQDLLNRHDALRASFSPDGEYVCFSPRVHLKLSAEDLVALPVAERESRLDAAIREEAGTSFDLLNGPLVRMRLFRLEHDYHALIFTSHHIICDGWSTNVLLDELGKLYSARIRGVNADLPLPMQFSEYARAQKESLGSAEMERVETYWLKQFEQLPTVPDFPTDRPRPAIKSFKGSTCRAHIDGDTCKRIKQAGSRHRCTLFSTLFAGFAALLHRLTTQEDIVIGIPTAGQSFLDNSNLVGHCVNFLPIRVNLPQDQTAAQLLEQVKQTVLDAYEHQTYTYGTLVRKLKLRRDPSRLPLVEVQFNLEKIASGLEFSGLRVEVDPNPKVAVNFDLFLNIVESDEGLLIDCDYNTEVFDRETIVRWMSHYEMLLKGIVADAGQLVDRLPLLTDGERHRMLVEWNATKADYPRDKTVCRLIEEQAERTPDSAAVRYQGQTLKYAELNSRANKLARYLIKLGVKPGSLVGLSIERSIEMIVGLLAIWKTGAAYLPVDPDYPRERLSFILEETAIQVLLTQFKLVPQLPVFDTRLVCLDRDWVLIENQPSENLEVAVDSEAAAYTIYTSGSTGKPKGVEVTHRNVANLLFSMREKPGLSSGNRLFAVTSLSFDISGLELFLPLIVGAEVIVASRETTVDGRLLREQIAETESTLMQATPATWQLLLEAGWKGGSGLTILCGGEALSRELAERLILCGQVWNMYGPTETTIWSATSAVESGSGPVLIGPPIRNTQFYVLDKHAQPLPIGVPGELYIGGDGVARGYYKRLELTAERFVPDFFSLEQNQRLYKTGDLVRYRPNGELEFLGRLDDQVKVRGFRIELGEIESVIGNFPGLRESVVVARDDEFGTKRLIAYVVAEGSEISMPDLRLWIGKFLPTYMIPAGFVMLPSLPRTPNGKVDRKSLPASVLKDPTTQETFVASRTPTESSLASICAEVLHLENVSVTDSLFDLGADSIHLFQIIARASRAGIKITPQHILRLRSVAAIAFELDSSGRHEQKDAPSEITKVSREQYRVRSARKPVSVENHG